MRRILSIPLILLFWLGPVAAILPGSDESRLPMCCRRHGAHHCTMPEDQKESSSPAFSAPSLCSSFPTSAPATIAPLFTPLSLSGSLPNQHVEMFSACSFPDFGCVGQPRTQEDRGPPSSAAA